MGKNFFKLLCALIVFFSVNLEAGIGSIFKVSDPKEIVTELLSRADVQVGGNRPWDISVHNEAFYARVIKEGSLGLGESYMDGWWDCPSLDQFFFKIFSAHIDSREIFSWSMLMGYLKAKFFNLQTKMGSLKVIQEHYQLGNDLFVKMLDDLMAYSCGYWKRSATLDEAQKAKFDLICRKLGFKPGMRVLDIGCGWGGFEKYAAETYGVQMVGVTLSENQAEYGRELCRGLPVEILIQDYRDVEGQFDRVLEIGMFEHVGAKNYRAFMELVNRVLKEDGMFMLHTIGRNTTATTVDPWITKYIFPNGLLPSIKLIGASIEGLFVMEDWHNFGPDYDTTLMAWHRNFNQNWDGLKIKYGPRFFRMWNYYLLSCAGAFRARQIQLWQVVLSKRGVTGGLETVR